MSSDIHTNIYIYRVPHYTYISETKIIIKENFKFLMVKSFEYSISNPSENASVILSNVIPKLLNIVVLLPTNYYGRLEIIIIIMATIYLFVMATCPYRNINKKNVHQFISIAM